MTEEERDQKPWHFTLAELSHGQDGNSIWLWDVPVWAYVLETLGEAFIERTGHIFCCNIPEWSYKIRWGKLDSDGWTYKSLGYNLHRFGQFAAMGFGSWKTRTRKGIIPVTYEWTAENYPHLGGPWDGTTEDSMRQKPGDEGIVL